jgi:hypothetical protein
LIDSRRQQVKGRLPSFTSRGRRRLPLRAHTSAAEGNRSQCSASQAEGGRYGSAWAGPRRTAHVQPAKGRQGVARWTRPGKKQRPIGPAGREWGSRLVGPAGQKPRKGERVKGKSFSFLQSSFQIHFQMILKFLFGLSKTRHHIIKYVAA